MKTVTRRIIYTLISVLSRLDRRQPEVFVLCYHGFSDENWRFNTSSKEFEKQLQYLKQHYQIISPGEFELYLQGKKTFTKPAVLISIDDGYKDVLNIQTMVKKHRISPLLFILSKSEQVNTSEIGNNKEFLSQVEVKELIQDGWVIGSHTATHPNLVRLNQHEREAEIRESKQDLECMYGVEVPSIAFPRGNYSEAVIEMVREAGYRIGFTMDDSHIRMHSDALRIPRIGVDRTHSFSEFKVLMKPLAVDFRRFVKSVFPTLAV